MFEKYKKVYKADYEKWYKENEAYRERVAADQDRLKFHLIHLMKNLKFVIQHSKRTVNISMIYLKFLNLISIVLILLYSMATKMIQILLILTIHLLS